MKKFFLIILILSFINGCGSVSDGFKLKKANTGDEFLVEKKNPLVLPPDFSELPKPGNTNMSNIKKEDNFESKIVNNNNLEQTDQSTSGSNSTEDFILKNIKKNETN